jgi:nicotinamide riboside kinase
MKIAVLGAECTGKTVLAKALSEALDSPDGGAHWVEEVLRAWCEQQGRTPQGHEQVAIAHAQALAIETAPPCAFLIADTTPLMTAIYSDLLFQDASLYDFALRHHQCYDLTLVTGLDLEWLPDGIQRDGPHARHMVDIRLREVLQRHAIPYAVVYGRGPLRTTNAIQAVRQWVAASTLTTASASAWQWHCDTCSDSHCEHRLFSDLLVRGNKSVRL